MQHSLTLNEAESPEPRAKSFIGGGLDKLGSFVSNTVSMLPFVPSPPASEEPAVPLEIKALETKGLKDLVDRLSAKNQQNRVIYGMVKTTSN